MKLGNDRVVPEIICTWRLRVREGETKHATDTWRYLKIAAQSTHLRFSSAPLPSPRRLFYPLVHHLTTLATWSTSTLVFSSLPSYLLPWTICVSLSPSHVLFHYYAFCTFIKYSEFTCIGIYRGICNEESPTRPLLVSYNFTPSSEAKKSGKTRKITRGITEKFSEWLKNQKKFTFHGFFFSFKNFSYKCSVVSNRLYGDNFFNTADSFSLLFVRKISLRHARRHGTYKVQGQC